MWPGTAQRGAFEPVDYQRLDELATRTEAQEAALNRGDVFAATLLEALDTTRWDDVVAQATPENSLWAAALQEHAGEVRRRLRHALSATAGRPAPPSRGAVPASHAQQRCWYA